MPINLLFDKACQLYLQRFTWSPVWYLIKPAIIFANIHVTPNIPGISTGRPHLMRTGSYQEVSSFFAPNINVSVTSCWIQLRLTYQEACSWWMANFWLNLGLRSSENINLLVKSCWIKPMWSGPGTAAMVSAPPDFCTSRNFSRACQFTIFTLHYRL